MFWYEFKLFLTHASGISMDALHVMAGVAIQALAVILLRVTFASWRPWLLLLGLEILNETLDLWVERWPNAAMQWGEGFKDVLLTMMLPTMILLAVRRRPALFSAARQPE